MNLIYVHRWSQTFLQRHLIRIYIVASSYLLGFIYFLNEKVYLENKVYSQLLIRKFNF